MRGVVMFGFQMLGLVNFEKRQYYVLFIKQENIYFFTPGPAMALLGPPGPTENDFLMREVVMFGSEMLGLVNFDKRKCNV